MKSEKLGNQIFVTGVLYLCEVRRSIILRLMLSLSPSLFFVKLKTVM